MLPPEEQERIWETVTLPTLIKNDKVPKLESHDADGNFLRILFKRNDEVFEMHKMVYDILEKRQLLDDIKDYFTEKAVVSSLLVYDDEGTKFKIELIELIELKGKTAAGERPLEVYKTAIDKKEGEDALNKLAFIAAKAAHAQALSMLFDAGVSPAITDGKESTLLHILANKYELSFRSSFYNSIHEMPAGAVEATVNLLLDNNVSALRKDEKKMTCYHYAARTGMVELVEALAKRSVKLNMTDEIGNNGIHIACEHCKVVMKQIDKSKIELERQQKLADEFAAKWKKEGKSSETIEEGLKKYHNSSLKKAKQECEVFEKLPDDYFRIIKIFTEAGVDPNQKNTRNISALELAIQNDLKKFAAFLSGTLTGDNDEAALATGGMTLHQAAEKGDAEAIKAIINAGADPNDILFTNLKSTSFYDKLNTIPSGFDGCTALTIAAYLFHVDAVEALLACGADPSFKNGKGRTAFRYLFTSTNAPLHPKVIEEKRIQRIVKAMLGSGFKIDAAVDEDDNTLLTLACRSSSLNETRFTRPKLKAAVIDEALKHKPNLNLTNRLGETALMCCCEYDFDIMENVQLSLLEGGADTALADKNGDTAMHYAARNKNEYGAKTLCEMLLEFGADAKAVNNKGKTALDIATEKNNEPLVKLLLTKM